MIYGAMGSCLPLEWDGLKMHSNGMSVSLPHAHATKLIVIVMAFDQDVLRMASHILPT